MNFVEEMTGYTLDRFNPGNIEYEPPIR